MDRVNLRLPTACDRRPMPPLHALEFQSSIISFCRVMRSSLIRYKESHYKMYMSRCAQHYLP